jgi:hypothetical protein
MNDLAFLILCATFSGVIISVLPLPWTEKIVMYIAVGALLAVSLAILERFEQRLYEVYQK